MMQFHAYFVRTIYINAPRACGRAPLVFSKDSMANATAKKASLLHGASDCLQAEVVQRLQARSSFSNREIRRVS